MGNNVERIRLIQQQYLNDINNPTTGKLAGFKDYTTEAINWYVDCNIGSDTNSGSTSADPLRTIQAAVDKVPAMQKHNQLIYLTSTGQYSNFTVSNKRGGNGTLAIIGDFTSTGTALNYVVTGGNIHIYDSYNVKLYGLTISAGIIYARTSDRVELNCIQFKNAGVKAENSYMLLVAVRGYQEFSADTYYPMNTFIDAQHNGVIIIPDNVVYSFNVSGTGTNAQWSSAIQCATNSKIFFQYGSTSWNIPSNLRLANTSEDAVVKFPTTNTFSTDSGKGYGRILSDGSVRFINYPKAYYTSVSSNYSCSTENLGEMYLYANTSASGMTITLPSAPAINRKMIVYDVSGSAQANNIIISGNGKTINGAASYTLTGNYSYVNLQFTDQNNWIINNNNIA